MKENNNTPDNREKLFPYYEINGKDDKNDSNHSKIDDEDKDLLFSESAFSYESNRSPYGFDSPKSPKRKDKYWLHALLFLLTILTTAMAGSEFVSQKPWFFWFSYQYYNLTSSITIPKPTMVPGWNEVLMGLPFSFAFLSFLTFHEFGHYLTAKWHKVSCSLPFYIPIFLPISAINIGSMGAVIRLRQQPDTTQKYFDIGVAGPLAGFVISIALLWYGFATLPPLEDYIFSLHPEYKKMFGHIPSESEMLATYKQGAQLLYIGNSLIFSFFEKFVADPARLPNHFEIMHYPFIFVGFISLFFTALNLLPIGQLDGGHVTYGLFGRKRAGIISRVTILILLIIGGLGIINFNNDFFDGPSGLITVGIYIIYLLFIISRVVGKERAFLALGISVGIILLQQGLQLIWTFDEPYNILWLIYALVGTRFIGLDHPPAIVESKLDKRRQIIGWVAIIIFILSFSPTPLSFI